MAAVVGGALAAQEQRIVARDPGQPGVRAVRGPAVGRREGRRPPLVLRAPRRVVVEPREPLPVRVRRRRRGLPEQGAGDEERGEQPVPAPAGQQERARHRRQSRAREEQRPGGEQAARQGPGREGEDGRRPAEQRPPVREAVREARPGGEDEDAGQDEGLAVRAAVRGGEDVPDEMRGAPLHRHRHRRAQPSPQPPLPAGRVPAEEQRPREQRHRRADEGRRGREAVRHREQPGQHVRTCRRVEVPDHARVGVPGAEEDGDEEGGREADAERRRHHRPEQRAPPEGVRDRQADQEQGDAVDVALVDGVGDFRLLSRRTVDAVLGLGEYYRSSREPRLLGRLPHHDLLLRERRPGAGPTPRWTCGELVNCGLDGLRSCK
ncbi:hypothetical protein STANM309S_00936 [Streptomyces tanashiensis]